MIIILVWIFFALVFAAAGSNKQIGYWGSFGLCLLTSPILGLIITLCLANKSAQVVTINYAAHYVEGEKQEYLGNNTEALKCYNEAYFMLHKYLEKYPAGKNEISNKKKIEDKIYSLGGTVKAV